MLAMLHRAPAAHPEPCAGASPIAGQQLVHGDLRSANILHEGREISAILDDRGVRFLCADRRARESLLDQTGEPESVDQCGQPGDMAADDVAVSRAPRDRQCFLGAVNDSPRAPAVELGRNMGCNFIGAHRTDAQNTTRSEPDTTPRLSEQTEAGCARDRLRGHRFGAPTVKSGRIDAFARPDLLGDVREHPI
jgi:hypothetical protein